MTSEMSLAGGEFLPSPFQDGLGLAVQQGLTAPHHTKSLKLDSAKPEQ